MADTIRERIIQAFTDRAAALSSLPVTRAARSMDETKAIFISVWDGDDQDQAPLYGLQPIKFPIALECIWQAGQENASVAANALLGEVVVTIMGPSTDRTFGGLATGIVKTSATPAYPKDGSDYTTLTVNFVVSYTIVSGDPYTLGEL